MSRWLFVAALLGCWGCAFSLDGPDPNRPRNRVPRCDTSKGLVALDGVMGTAFGVTSLALASNDEAGVALLPLALGALYIGGAVAGNRSVDACRKAIAEYDLSYSRDERYALGDDEDEDEDDETPRRKQGLIPRPVPAGQGTVPPRYPTYPQQGAQPPTYPPPTYPAPTYPAPGQPPVAQPQPQPQPQQPVAQPAPQQPVAQPAPAQPPRTKKQPKAPRPQEDGGEWTDFWREVP